MKDYIILGRGVSTMSVYRRELKRMEQECGNSCPDWYSEVYEDKLEEFRNDDGTLDFDSFEYAMVDYADDYIKAELRCKDDFPY